MIPTQAQLFSAHGAQRPTLPPMQELTSRISEAQTSAKVLEQILLSTPTVDVPTHELIREFAQRCKLALRSIQGFLATDEATLDEGTTTTLIETNDLLSSALEKHRKAVNEAKEALARQERERDEGEAEGPGEDPFRDQPSPVSPVVRSPCCKWEGFAHAVCEIESTADGKRRAGAVPVLREETESESEEEGPVVSRPVVVRPIPVNPVGVVPARKPAFERAHSGRYM